MSYRVLGLRKGKDAKRQDEQRIGQRPVNVYQDYWRYPGWSESFLLTSSQSHEHTPSIVYIALQRRQMMQIKPSEQDKVALPARTHATSAIKPPRLAQ